MDNIYSIKNPDAVVATATDEVPRHSEEPERGIAFTRFTKNKRSLTKRLSLRDDGELVKDGSECRMARGVAETVQVESLSDFAAVLKRLGHNQALAYGVCGRDEVPIVSSGTPLKDRPAGAIERSRAHFGWGTGPGVLMLDYDPSKSEGEPLKPAALIDALCSAVPALANVEMLWMPSAGSCVYHADTGKEIAGIRGQRVYILLDRASEIPRVGALIFARCWLAGFGHFNISAAGSLLDRSLVDAAVFQPERLDFAAGAICDAPLVQRRREPELVEGDKPMLAVADLNELTPAERERLEAMKAAARASKEPEARAVRERRIEERAQEVIAKKGISDPDKIAVVRESFRSAIEGGELLADFMLWCDTHEEDVSVAEVLENPEKYHGARFADPIEPGCYNDMRIAWANLRSGTRPYIWSHAHGGRRFVLRRQSDTLRLAAGDRDRAVDFCMDVTRGSHEIFDRGGMLVRPLKMRICPVEPHWLMDWLDREISFQRYYKRSKDGAHWQPVDCPRDLADICIKKSGQRGLPELRAVISAPMIDPAGRLIDAPGYDAESDLLLMTDDPGAYSVGRDPSIDDALAALRTLWEPFNLFPYVDAISRSVHLAAVLTAVTRATMRGAPGILYDAPTAGTGKTLLARCVGALVLGKAPGTTSPKTNDDAEMRKDLFSRALGGQAFICIDNVDTHLKSPSLCDFLTSDEKADRVLAMSKIEEAANVAMVTVTGNNVCIVGDLNRRMLRCRLDTREENPHRRAFKLDPLDYVLRRRWELCVAACTILRAYHCAGAPRLAEDRLGSFEQWSDTVRQAVMWLGMNGGDGIVGGPLVDPTESIEATGEADPERVKLASLLHACREAFGGAEFTVKDIRERCGAYRQPGQESLRDAVTEITGQDYDVNPRMLGRWIEKRAERPLDGLRFVRSGMSRQKTALWVVQQV